MKKEVTVPLFALVAFVSGALACGVVSTPAPTLTPTQTPTPLPLQAPGWEEVTIHTLCLEVEQSYPQVEKAFSQPIGEATKRILGRVGIQVVDEGECEATLAITLTGRALGGEYTLGYCYSGAEVSGRVQLAASGRAPLTLPVSGKYPTPFMIRGCPGETVDAPFENAWAEALLEGLAHLWGPHVLIQALRDEEWVVRWRAAEALGEAEPQAVEAVPALIQALEDENEDVREAAAETLGLIGPEAVEAVPALIQTLGDKSSSVRKAAAEALELIGPEAVEAVPALIQALGDESSSVRSAAAEALKAITGQDFGEDADRWREWWEERRSDTPGPPTSDCTPDAVFEADVTIPDGTSIEAGQPFVKTWRIRNAGTCDWDARYRLAFVDGDRMGGPDSVAVPETSAGESVEISVELVAPAEQGEYRAYWQMCVDETDCFGDRVYVQIVSTE